jgi:hypothetical protein
MANDESDALDVLEKEAKEYDKVSLISFPQELITNNCGRMLR